RGYRARVPRGRSGAETGSAALGPRYPLAWEGGRPAGGRRRTRAPLERRGGHDHRRHDGHGHDGDPPPYQRTPWAEPWSRAGRAGGTTVTWRARRGDAAPTPGPLRPRSHVASRAGGGVPATRSASARRGGRS